MEKYLGRSLPEKSVVHHVNLIKTDNRIENLLLLRNSSDHAFLHTLISLKKTSLVEATEEWSLSYMEDLRAGSSESDLATDTPLENERNSKNELFNQLRTKRSELSKRLNVPAYIIARDSSLLQISQDLPINERELLEIKGIGPKKLKAFGAEFLTVVRYHLENQPTSSHSARKLRRYSG